MHVWRRWNWSLDPWTINSNGELFFSESFPAPAKGIGQNLEFQAFNFWRTTWLNWKPNYFSCLFMSFPSSVLITVGPPNSVIKFSFHALVPGAPPVTGFWGQGGSFWASSLFFVFDPFIISKKKNGSIKFNPPFFCSQRNWGTWATTIPPRSAWRGCVADRRHESTRCSERSPGRCCGVKNGWRGSKHGESGWWKIAISAQFQL